MKKTFGYARVSTPKQTIDPQLELLNQAGCEEIFVETGSGANRKRPDELFGEEVHFTTKRPVRLGESVVELKHVYVISHPNYPGEFKVGIAKDVKARLNSYQTSAPDRRFQLEYSRQTPHFRELETYIHQKFENKHEWVLGQLDDIKSEIDNFE